MDTHDQLFELIKSLSKSEKGYFKKISSVHNKGKQNNYMILFDAIDRRESYDERNLKSSLPGKIASQLSFLKHYLYHQLLESLDQYYQSSNVEINKMICKVEILHKKGLKSQGLKLLGKAMDFAGKKEKFYYLLHLTSLRYEFLADEEDKERIQSELEILNNDLKELRRKIGNLYEYYQLRIELNLLWSTTGFARTEEEAMKYRALLQRPLLLSESAALSGSAKFHFYTLRSIIQNYAHQYEEAYASLQKIDHLFQEFPILFEESVTARIKTWQRQALNASTLKKFDLSMKSLEQMRSLKAVHEKYRVLIFQYGFHQEFLIYLLTGKFSALIERLPSFMEEYQVHSRNIIKTFELQMLQRISQAFFIEGKFEDAMGWINKAINTIPSAFCEDVVSGIKIDEILTHFELGNFRVLTSKITAAEKYLRSKGRPFAFEMFLLSFLKKIPKVKNEQERKEQWRKAYEHLMSQFYNTRESLPVKYFYISAWMESKFKNRSLSEVLKKHPNKSSRLK